MNRLLEKTEFYYEIILVLIHIKTVIVVQVVTW